MPGETEVQEEFVERAECFGLELDEGLMHRLPPREVG